LKPVAQEKPKAAAPPAVLVEKPNVQQEAKKEIKEEKL